MSAAFAELCGVVEKIREHLNKAHRVAFNVNRLGRQRHSQHMTAPLDRRTARFDRYTDQSRQLDPLFSEFQFVAGDTAHIEKVIQEPRHMLSLTPDDIRCPLQLRVGRTLQS